MSRRFLSEDVGSARALDWASLRVVGRLAVDLTQRARLCIPIVTDVRAGAAAPKSIHFRRLHGRPGCATSGRAVRRPMVRKLLVPRRARGGAASLREEAGRCCAIGSSGSFGEKPGSSSWPSLLTLPSAEQEYACRGRPGARKNRTSPALVGSGVSRRRGHPPLRDSRRPPPRRLSSCNVSREHS